MHGNLRLRIIIFTMACITAVICAISGAINISNYFRQLGRQDALLDLISDYNGTIPHNPHEIEDKVNFFVSSETPFQTRYFVILVNNDGAVTDAMTSNIASVGKGDIDRIAAIVKHRKDGARGSIGSYRYLVKDTEHGKMLSFLDCSQDREATAQLILVSFFTALVSLVCIFLIIILISGKIIQPFIRNQEKQKQFITDAGHELKTPLAIIRTNAEVLECCYGKNEWIDSIQHQTTRLDNLVKGLLRLSRSSEAEIGAHPVKFSLSAAVNETAESFKTVAESKGHKMHFDITPGIDYKGDSQSISTLVSILVDNAIKYVSDDGEIFVSLSRMGMGTAKTAKLVVENDTTVDDSTDLNRFFERFYRYDGSRSTTGYGIGLSVAKNITEAHKGKISVSKNGKRIAFTVIL